MISLSHVSMSFDGGRTRAVDDVSLEVAAGELVVLIGESGCGKTTTLKMINRLVEPSSGTIHVDGSDVSSVDPVALRRRIGYVIQGIGLFPHRTVSENIATVPVLLGWSEADREARVRALLSTVGLPFDEFAHRFPGELSGGQQQRVGVARALAGRPDILLMDEPFGALDPLTRIQMQDELIALHRSLELTIILVSHDMSEALLLADRIVVMSAGRIVADDTPAALLNSPQDDAVETLMALPRRQAQRIEQLAAGDDV